MSNQDEAIVTISYDKILRDEPDAGAILFLVEPGIERWVPRSQITEHNDQEPDDYWFEIPEWLAIRLDLV